MEAVTKKMDDNRLEYETKLDEMAKLLDIRAARIRVSKKSQIISVGHNFQDRSSVHLNNR